MELTVPRSGHASRVRKGQLEVVLKQGSSGYILVTHDGYQGRQHLLGLPEEGNLWLVARTPEHRVVVELEDPRAVAPGARLRGYVAVPLPHRVAWTGGGEEKSLLEILPRDMETRWLGEEQGYEHRVVSKFYSASAVPGEPTTALVPVVLQNRRPQSVVPRELVVHLQDRDLHVVRGRIVAAPRRIVFTDNGTEEHVRWLPGEMQ